MNRLKLALAFCIFTWFTASPPARASDGEPWIPNEWGPLSGIVVSTETGADNKEVLNPLAPEIIKAAVDQGLKVVIADHNGDPAAIIQSLKDQNVITNKNANLISVTKVPLQSGWARDTGPIVRLRGGNAPEITGTMAFIGDWSPEKAQAADQAIAQALGNLKTAPIPTFTTMTQQGMETLPIQADGGNWLPTTLQNKKVLLTTLDNIYYGDVGFRPQVDPLLKQEFGIDQTLTLTPIPQVAMGYQPLSNNHLDLQIRTLPDNKVLVADVPAGDPMQPSLNKIAQDLAAAGFNVIRIPNTQSIKNDDGKLIYTSYTNAVPINNTWLIPSYGDAAADANAAQIYRDALGPGFDVVSVDVSSVAASCGALRCALREIPAAMRALPVLPSKPSGKEASSQGNPRISYDAASQSLNFSPAQINLLGDPGVVSSNPAYVNDILDGAMLQVSGLSFNSAMSEGSQYTFTGGELVISSNGTSLLTARIPTFTINGIWPDAALAMSGVLADLTALPELDTSTWFYDFSREVLDDPALLPDLFATSSIDLITLSNGFTSSFSNVELQRLGIVGNGNIPEPATYLLLATGLLYIAMTRIAARRNAGQPRQGLQVPV